MTLLEAAELYMMVEGTECFNVGNVGMAMNLELLKQLEIATGYIGRDGWGLVGLYVDLEIVWLEAHRYHEQP